MAAIAWLAQRRDEPYFLWVHFFDAHSPYDPPPPFRGRFGSGPPERRLGEAGWLTPGTEHDADTAHNNGRLYDAEILFADTGWEK